MSIYKLFKISAGEIMSSHPDPSKGFLTPWNRPDDNPPPDPGIDMVWLVDEARPNHDPSKQRLKRVKTETRLGWDLVDLTAQELAARVPEIEGVTKLTIMRRLEALNKWGTFKTILAQLSEQVQDGWSLAQEIKSDDPLFAANAAAFKGALSLTDAQFTALLTP